MLVIRTDQAHFQKIFSDETFPIYENTKIYHIPTIKYHIIEVLGRKKIGTVAFILVRFS